MRKKGLFLLVVLAPLLIGTFVPGTSAAALRADALVLVNSQSEPGYTDGWLHIIKPYLDHFGVPYTTLDIAISDVSGTIGDYALIIVGHRGLDPGHAYLTSVEESYISGAVYAGTGLVNFDNYLSADASSPLYQFVNNIFGFTYGGPTSGSGVTIEDTGHYITALNPAGWSIGGSMTLAGINLPASGAVTAVATSSSAPFVAVTTYGTGRAVEFVSYEFWPLYGLDSLVWRSIVWAARKPFVMQGLPPFVTMRVDDDLGPFDWVHLANEVGLKPWVGFNIGDIDDIEAADLSALVNSGNATATIHGGPSIGFFYAPSPSAGDLDQATWQANFNWGTQWMQAHNIPPSKFVLPQYYRFGTNNFSGTADIATWGVEFLGTIMDPGAAYGAPWLQIGPFNQYGVRGGNIFYADFMNIPNHPELNGKFFNCMTEIRDDNGYEWYPVVGSPQAVASTIAHGTAQLKRALDAMALPTLFTHGFSSIDAPAHQYPDDYRAVFQGIMNNLASYNPIPDVTMEYACQYLRAMKTSDIATASYDPDTKQLTVNFTGHTDIATKYYVFTDAGGQFLADVPQFTGSTTVSFTVPGPLDHIRVTPESGTVIAGGTLQFSATAYDVDGNVIPTQHFAWSIASPAAGTISSGGLFTAGATTGTFTDAVVASIGTIQGMATVQVTAPVMDHFEFSSISSPRYAGTQFTATITARTAAGDRVITYNGSIGVSASAGILTPTTVTITGGVWTGALSIATSPPTGVTLLDVTLTASDGSYSGTSNAFDVEPLPVGPYTIWGTGAATGQLGVPAGGNDPVEVGVRFRSAVDGTVTGVRFWKDPQNTGTHVGHLWSNTGALLATATFTDETPSGWQEVRFSSPVEIMAGTTYVASYHTNYFTYQLNYFASGHDSPPLRALRDGEDGANSIYLYDREVTGSPPPSGPYFPSKTYNSSNYWVDVIVEAAGQSPVARIEVAPSTATLFTEMTQQFTARAFYADGTEVASPQFIWGLVNGGGTINSTGLFTAGTMPGTYTVVALFGSLRGSSTVTVQPRVLDHFEFATIATPQYPGAPFTVSITARDASGSIVTNYAGTATLTSSTGSVTPPTVTFTGGSWTGQVTINNIATGITLSVADGAATGTSNAFDVQQQTTTYSIWGNASPTDPSPRSPANYELGVRFRASITGSLLGLRFWKATCNTGTHVGHLWTNTGTLLATATFTSETSSGWQEVRFTTPVPVTAGTTYVASYSVPTCFVADVGYFATTGHDNPPLRALRNGEDGFNGIYSTTQGAFPTSTYNYTNYWVDVIFSPSGAPNAVNDSYATVENVTLNTPAPGVLTNDSDPNGDPLTAIPVSGPSHGTLSLNTDGSFTYTPNASYSGSDSFTYKANDGSADSNVATVTITVNAVNHPPVASADGYSTNQNTQLVVPAPGVLGNDTDLDGNPLTAILVAGPSHGSLVLNANGSFAYTPNLNYNGPDSFTYKANDGLTDSNVATVTVSVNAVNQAPVASNDSYSTNEDAPLIVAAPGLLGNDSDVEGNPLTAILVSGPSRGTITLNSNGSFTYTPSLGFFGTDRFTYKANDGSVDSNVATVNITVNTVSPSWFNQNWVFRTPITVSSPCGSEETNYQVRITLGSTFSFGHAKADGTDLRVTHNDGSTEIPFWIEKWNSLGKSADIWVKVPFISASGVTIYLYYGNPSANAASDGEATFEFFDDNWEMGGGNPIHTIEGEGTWVTDYVSYPNIFKEGDTYYMLYDGHTPHQKGLATSTDLTNWTSLPDPVVRKSDITGAWDQTGVAWGDTIKVGDTYYMLVAGLSGDGRWRIGVETSTDRVNWNRAPADATNPVLVATESWEGGMDGSLSGTSILKELDGITPVLHAGKYWMAYHDYSYYQIGIASADSPLGPWTKFAGNPILSPTESWESSGLWVASLVKSGERYYIFYYGRSGMFHMGYAWCNVANFPGGPWTKTTTPILQYGPSGSWDDTDHEDPMIRKFGDTYYLFYTGRGARYANGFATAPTIEGPFTKYEGESKWNVGGSPTATDGIVRLTASTTRKDRLESQAFSTGHAMGYRANFTGNGNLNSYKWGGFLTPPNNFPFAYIGVAGNPATPGVAGGNLILTTYQAPSGPRYYADLGPVTNTFHVYEVTWRTGEIKAYIDHVQAGSAVTNAVPSGPLPIQFQNYNDTTYPLDIDWVYVRKWCGADASVVAGTEESTNAPPVANDDTVTTAEDAPITIDVAANDSDVDGNLNRATSSATSGPSNGTLVNHGDGTFTYSPNPNFSGSDSFVYQICDFAGACDTATANITITPVNDPPVLGVIGDKTVDEMTQLTFTATATDVDAPPNTLTFSLAGAPEGASIDPSTGVFSWTPTEAQGSGRYNFDVCVSDGALSDCKPIAVSVNEVNRAPELGAIGNRTVNEMNELTFTATANDMDVPANTLGFSLVGSPAGASINASTGAFSWTPTEAQGPGSYTFIVKVCDNGTPVLCTEQTITITVNEVNSAPVLVSPGDKTVDELTVLNFTLSASDPDIPANTLTYSISSGIQPGMTLDSASGAFSWTPTEAQGPGTYTVTFRVTDNGTPALFDEKTITITVNMVNDPPMAISQAVLTDEDKAVIVTLAATDADGNSLTFSVVSQPGHGKLGTIVPVQPCTTDENGTSTCKATVTYTPDANYNKPDSFTFKVNDGTVGSIMPATVTITFNAIPDMPLANSQSLSITEDPVTPATITMSGTDFDGDCLIFSVAGHPKHGQLGFIMFPECPCPIDENGISHCQASITYMPGQNFYGADSFTFQVTKSDGTLRSAEAEVSIDVTPINDPPIAEGQPVTTDEDTAITINLRASDIDSLSLSFSVVAAPIHGTLSAIDPVSCSGDGSGGSVCTATVAYRPAKDYSGPDTFTFKANDSSLADSNMATVTITVNAVNDRPIADDKTVTTLEDTLIAIPLSGRDTETPAEGLTFTVTVPPQHGTLTGTGPNLTYTPAANYNGDDSFKYIVTDTGDGTSAPLSSEPATVLITISPVNDPPVASANPPSQDVRYGDKVSLVTFTAMDIDSRNLTIDSSVMPPWLTLSALTCVPEDVGTKCDWKVSGQADAPAGSYTVEITVTDGELKYTARTNIEVAEEATQLLASSASVQYSDSVVLSATLTDDEGTGLRGKTVHFEVDGVGACNGDVTTNASGMVTFTCGPVGLAAGQYQIFVSYAGENGYYQSTSGTATLAVSEETTKLTANATSVQYSDSVVLSATLADDEGTPLLNKIVHFQVAGAGGCSGDGITDTIGAASFTCEAVGLAAGSYAISVSYAGENGHYLSWSTTSTLTVTAEDAAIDFDDGNPVAVPVVTAGGNSGAFQLIVYVSEAMPDHPADFASLGDINYANAIMTLQPVGPGEAKSSTCQVIDSQTGSNPFLRVKCDFTDVPVNTYTVQADVGGNYYDGYAEDVLVVYDPSLGFATGGGWFYWPGSQNPVTNYPGDRTNFGFTMKYSKKGTNVQGSLLLIRHLPDGSIYRIKSNALYGLALGEKSDSIGLYGWASFSGKATYLEPSWADPIGNYQFIVYVEDHNEPGKGIDRFWIETRNKDGNVVQVMSMPRDASNPQNNEDLQGGNIVVPHRAR